MAQLVETARPTAIFLGPAHAVALQNAGILDNHDFSSVRFSVFSGAYCPPDLLRTYHSSTGSIVCQLWGMTECQCGMFTRPDESVEAAAAGATTVDLYPVISDKTLTHTHVAEGTGDIHPNDSGYRLIADAIIAAYKAGK